MRRSLVANLIGFGSPTKMRLWSLGWCGVIYSSDYFIYKFVCTYVCTYIYHIYTVYTYTYVYVIVPTYIYICMYVSISLYVRTYLRMYIYIGSSADGLA